MKHLYLILMCLSVCLIASGATPRLNSDKKAVAGKPAYTLLKKDNTVLNRLTSPVMTGEKIDVITPQRFFTEYNVTPNDNRLLKKAPHRVGADELLSTKIAFMERYEYDSEVGEVERSKCYYDGGWDVGMEMVDDDLFYAYIYYNQIPVCINVDYSSNTAVMAMEPIGVWHWADTIRSGSTTTINDTVEYLGTWDEDFYLAFMSGDDYAEARDLTGTIYEDGTLWFPDGWLLYQVEYVTKTITRNGRSTVTCDTIAMVTDIFRDTYLMTPNANHSFKCDYQYTSGNTMTVTENCNAYMFQYDDSTVVAWNMWGVGGRGNFMYIHEDGSMDMPIGQVVGTRDVTDLEEVYPEYDWSEGYEYILMNYDIAADTYLYEDIVGVVGDDAIYWSASQLWNYCKYGGDYYALPSYPMYDNLIAFTDGSRFMFGKAETPQIVVTEGDGCYTFTAVTGDGSEPYLFTMNPATGDLEQMVNNPYVVVRTTEDQEINLAAIADGFNIGKNMSEMATGTFVVPALEAAVVGDVNGDGCVNIEDITSLIDLLLHSDGSGVSGNIADIDSNGILDIADLVALIDMILSAK